MQKTKRSKRPNSGSPNVIATNATIRFTQPSSKNRTPKQNPLVTITPDELVGGFINFLRDHAIVGLAVGFAIATQVQSVVKQLVSSFITPTFQLFFKGALANDAITWHMNGHKVTYSWGIFVSDLLDFLFVLAVLYLIVRFFRLDKLDRPKSPAK